MDPVFSDGELQAAVSISYKVCANARLDPKDMASGCDRYNSV